MNKVQCAELLLEYINSVEIYESEYKFEHFVHNKWDLDVCAGANEG